MPKRYTVEMSVTKFWERVDKSGDCWIWTGTKCSAGYGSMRFKDRVHGAHRLSWLFTFGVWPTYLMHSCDVRNCVNPAHLSEGDHAKNMADRNAKGRAARQFGTSNGRSKLTEDDVHTIRAMYDGGTMPTEIAKGYSVATFTVAKVCKRRSWTRITERGQP